MKENFDWGEKVIFYILNNTFEQISHLKGFSPVWVLSWIILVPECLNTYTEKLNDYPHLTLSIIHILGHRICR